MFKKIFALALVLVLVAICTRRPIDAPLSGKLPNTCKAAHFAGAVDELDEIASLRDQALARIDALPRDEPADYLRRWQAEVEAMRELDGRAEKVWVPRCLLHAKDLFVQYMDQTQDAVERRAPDKDLEDYRRARETADALLAQYRAELKLQEKNRE